MKTNSSFWKGLTIALICVVLLGMGVPARSVSAQTNQDIEFPQENAWARVTPSVVWCGDEGTPVTIDVHIVGRNDVARVWVTDLGTSLDEAQAELFDDGTHGDAAAGDRVFTLGGVVLPCNPDYFSDRGWSNWWGFLRVELTDGTRAGNNYGMVAGLVDPQFKDAFSVHDFGNGLSATAYAFFILDSSHEVMDNYPLASVYCGTSNFQAYRRFYSVMPDAFDFALVMPGMQILRPSDLAENVPYEVNVSNHVQHIGMDIFDDTAEFGSAGTLKAAIYHSFGSTAIVDHEMGHAWGMDLGASLGLVTSWEGNPMLGHWSEMADIQGQMGAYYFDDNGNVGHFAYNGDGTWRLIANTTVEPYSPLELYAMGMILPEEVPPIHILQAPDLSNPDRITAASYQTVSIDQILQAEGGARNPSAAESQKDFALAFIVTQDTPFDEAAYAYFSLISHELMSQDPPLEYSSQAPFYWATGGRGTLTTRLPVDVAEPAWLPGMPTPMPAPAAETAQPSGETAQPSAEPTRVPSPICRGLLGLVLIPGLWLLLKKRPI